MGFQAPSVLAYLMKKYAPKPGRRAKRVPRQPAPRPPIPVERSYLRDLMPYLEIIQEVVKQTIIPALPSLVRSLEFQKPSHLRNDGIADDLVGIIKLGRTKVSERFTPEEMARIARLKGVETSAWNKAALNRGLKKVIGIDVAFPEPWMNDALSLFTLNNVDLISSIADDAFYDMQNLLMSGIQQGERWENMADQIEAYVDPSIGRPRTRAELIARDQVSKFNATVNQLRQSEVGVRRYTWRTVGDDRVRDTHVANDGKVFDWDDPPSQTGHPGDDINCRCWAEPVLDDLIEGLDDPALGEE